MGGEGCKSMSELCRGRWSGKSRRRRSIEPPFLHIFCMAIGRPSPLGRFVKGTRNVKAGARPAGRTFIVTLSSINGWISFPKRGKDAYGYLTYLDLPDGARITRFPKSSLVIVSWRHPARIFIVFARSSTGLAWCLCLCL